MKIRKICALALAAMLLCSCSAKDSGSSLSDEKSSQAEESKTEQAVTTEEKIVYEIDKTKPLIALTFDDGPNTTTTNDVLDKLVEHQVPATFFLIGNNITEESGEVVKRAHALGCEIENHSLTHSYMNKMTAEEILAEIDATNSKIEELTGEKPKFFRPPYIATGQEMYDVIDMTFICGVGANDWDSAVGIEKRAQRIIEQADDGIIILLHDSEGNFMTVAALDEIITTLKEQGYQFVTLSELFELKGVNPAEDDMTQIYSKVVSIDS